VRRHRRDPSTIAGAGRFAAPGVFARLALAALAAALAALALAATAVAAAPTFDHAFACDETTKCDAVESWTPGRLSVDEASGDVYVLDQENDAVQHFDAQGKYLGSLLGSKTGQGTFNFGGDDDVAVDNSGTATQGDVYVNSENASIAGKPSVFAFDASGNLLWESKPTGFTDTCGIAVTAAGQLYASDFAGGVIPLSSTDGSPTGAPIVVTGNSCHIAFDSAGNLFLNKWVNEVLKYMAPTYTTSDQVDGTSSFDVATDSTNGDAYTVPGNEVHVFDTSGSPPFPGTPFGAAEAIVRSVTVNGAAGKIYVTNLKTTNRVEIYSRVGGAAAKPSARTEAPSSLGPEAATLAGKANPNGTATTCAFEYGTSTTLGSSQPCSASVGSGTAEVPVSAQVSGLSPNTTYYARLVTSGAGTTNGAIVKFQTPKPTHALTTTLIGQGSVQCKLGAGSAGPCAAEYEEGAEVTVIATAASHNHFVAWKPGCDSLSGTGSSECHVTMATAPRPVESESAPTMRSLTVNKAGSGSGTLTCNGGACAASYQDGTQVTIGASAASGSSFGGWSGGGCSGTGSTCVTTLAADTTVTATFNANPVVIPPKPPVVVPPVTNPKPKILKCKKGFKKKTVKGKAKCVKVKKHHKKHH
jgi:Divergent InlB B-repeat domain